MKPQYDVLGKQNNQQLAEEDIPFAEFEVVEDILIAENEAANEIPLAEFEVVEDIPFAVVEQEESVLMVVEDVFPIIGMGTVIVGEIKNGTVSVGESVIINEKRYVVNALENFKKLIKEASSGMDVGMLLKGAGKKDFKRGDLVYKKP